MPVLKNPRWETFVQALIAGDSQRVAYRKAFPSSKKWKDNTVDSRASELYKNSEIVGRYNELKEAAATGAVLTRKEKRELLAEMARDESLLPADRQRAIDLDNKMEDEYTSRVEMSGTVNPLAGLTTEELKKLIDDD